MRPAVRVLYVHHTSRLGGAEYSLIDMLRAMNKRAIVPAIALPSDGPLSERLFQMGVDVYFTPVAKPKRTPNPVRLLENYAGIASGIAGVTYAASSHGAHIIHANSLAAAPCAGPASGLSRTHSVLHLRDMIRPGIAGNVLLKMFSAVVAVSLSVAEFYGRECDVIPSGIDFDRFDTETSRSVLKVAACVPRDCRLIGMTGQMVGWKRHADFIRAASRIASVADDVHFIIAGSDVEEGDTGYRSGLEDLADELDLGERIHFAGWVDDMAAFYRCLDVLIHPAVDEPFGRAVVEAMSCGVPVICCDSGGPAGVVSDGTTGLLVPAGDWRALAGAARRLLDDEELRASLADAARKDVRSRFSAELSAFRMMELYISLLDEPTSGSS